MKPAIGGSRTERNHTTAAIHCPRCRVPVRPAFSKSGPHLRADCPTCGRFIAFIKKSCSLYQVFEEQEIAEWERGSCE